MGRSRAKNERTAESFLPLKPRVFLMLLSLVQGQSHGYALKEELLRRTDGRLNLGPGTLYRTIQSLLKEGLTEESHERPAPESDDERRRYYRITPLGQSVPDVLPHLANRQDVLDFGRYRGVLNFGRQRGIFNFGRGAVAREQPARDHPRVQQQQQHYQHRLAGRSPLERRHATILHLVGCVGG